MELSLSNYVNLFCEGWKNWYLEEDKNFFDIEPIGRTAYVEGVVAFNKKQVWPDQ